MRKFANVVAQVHERVPCQGPSRLRHGEDARGLGRRARSVGRRHRRVIVTEA